MAQTETLYILDIKVPDEENQRIPVQGKLSLGSSGDADLCFVSAGLAPRHCTFRDNNEVLTVQNTGGEGAVVVGKQKLGHGKMYIVDKGDSVKFGDLTVVIRTEEAEVEYVGGDDEYYDDDDTSPGRPEKEGRSIVESITALFKRAKKKEEEDEDMDVQVIDHSEDDEDEDDDGTAPRQVKASGAIGKIKPKKVRVSPYSKQRRAGAIIRTLGFLMNLAAVYSVYLYVIPKFGLEPHFQKIFEMLTPHIEKILPMVSPHVPENYLTLLTSYAVIKIICIFIILELVSNILFGVSTGLFLLGVTGHGGFIGKRFKGMMRTLWSFVTSPFIITELPALLKYRTLKEALSFSQIEKRSNILSLLLGATIAPIAIIAAFLWPLANDPTLLKQPEYEQVAKAVKRKGKKPLNFVSTSKYFGLKVGFYKKPTLEFLPSKEKTGVILYAMDLKKAHTVTIKKAKEVDLNPEFKSMLEMNPFFSSFTPNLYQFMANQKDSKEISGEIADLTRDSLGITPLRLHEVLLDHGPYINGLMDIRVKLINAMGITGKFKATYFKAARKPYLLVEEESTNANQTTYVLPLGEMKVEPIVLSFKAKERSLANTIIENIFKTAGKLPKEFEYSSDSVETWNDLTTLDLLASEEKKISDSAFEGIIEFYRGKVDILKDPQGFSAKGKKLFNKNLKKVLKRTSEGTIESGVGAGLKALLDELPNTEVKKEKPTEEAKKPEEKKEE